MLEEEFISSEEVDSSDHSTPRLRLQEWMQDAGAVKAEIVRFQITYQMLGLRLWNFKREAALYLLCGGCQSLEGPIVWEMPSIEISSLEGNRYDLLRDAKAGLELKCGAIWVITGKYWFFDSVDVLPEPQHSAQDERPATIGSDSRYLREMEQRRIDLDSRECLVIKVTAFVKAWTSRFETVGAIIWSYREASRRFEIRLQADNEYDNLHIVCGGCHFVRSKVWTANVSIEALPSPSGPSRWFIRDGEANFSVECDFLQISANVPPQFRTFC
jgi:hypothetical protein